MSQGKGIYLIRSLQKKWNAQILLSCALLSVAISTLISSISVSFFGMNPYFIPIILLISSAFTFVLFVKKTDAQAVVRFLNTRYPKLEESTQLMLQSPDDLNALQKLQLRKIEAQLGIDIALPSSIRKRLLISFLFVCLSALLAACLVIFPSSSFSTGINKTGTGIIINKPENRLPEITNVSVTTTPPLYTKKGARTSDRFTITAEQKAVVTWNITTTKKATELRLIFNDKSITAFKPKNKDSTEWTTSRQIVQPGFYQLSFNKKLSELYQVEMIRDEAPGIAVQSPKQNTFIKWGESQKIIVNAMVSDDYGVDSAYLQATTASGSGEAVKFKELRFPFSNFQKGVQKASLQKTLDLPSIGLTPGDELYFFITAKDNNKQEKRSDVFIVRLEDTAQLFSMSGLTNGVDVRPELFRSQRQIIIETEQLLREKDTISEASFNRRSGDIGTDQQLLRLRYGKYLGEETETEVGGDHHNEEGYNDAADFGNADKIINEFSHKHDIAEDADFFDAPTKKQLQAMLTEMWKASLGLKTYKPKEALPFEYNALRLLKDLQQKTRVYVGKTGVKTTPLNPDKRMSGELDKIMQQINKGSTQQPEDATIFLRKAIGVLEMIRNGEVLQPDDKEVLDKSSTQLSIQAALHPATYLPALQALQRIQNKKARKDDNNLVGNAFQKMIRTVYAAPQSSSTSPDMDLSKRYFKNLMKRND